MNYQKEYNKKIKENVGKVLQELYDIKTSFAMQINELKEFLSKFNV